MKKSFHTQLRIMCAPPNKYLWLLRIRAETNIGPPVPKTGAVAMKNNQHRETMHFNLILDLLITNLHRGFFPAIISHAQAPHHLLPFTNLF